MRGRILGAAIGLDLDDAADATVDARQQLVQKLLRDYERIAAVEGPRQRLAEGNPDSQ
jgi:hypothetical protein